MAGIWAPIERPARRKVPDGFGQVANLVSGIHETEAQVPFFAAPEESLVVTTDFLEGYPPKSDGRFVDVIRFELSILKLLAWNRVPPVSSGALTSFRVIADPKRKRAEDGRTRKALSDPPERIRVHQLDVIIQ
ncbi:MAG: hypothetical protein M5U32_16150 [Myxococcota bacterium]|nr:hypothetical protein [Myxococcota bacterium]